MPAKRKKHIFYALRQILASLSKTIVTKSLNHFRPLGFLISLFPKKGNFNYEESLLTRKIKGGYYTFTFILMRIFILFSSKVLQPNI